MASADQSNCCDDSKSSQLKNNSFSFRLKQQRVQIQDDICTKPKTISSYTWVLLSPTGRSTMSPKPLGSSNGPLRHPTKERYQGAAVTSYYNHGHQKMW
ncbi:hypothetical protein DMENIID0001_168400 [Sergentomyia squamirostris]